MYYINTLKRELVDTNAYKLQPSLSERVIVDGHGCQTALHFGDKAKENQDKVPTLYWLPKLHKKSYKARFIANSNSCTTTELSKLLTSCLAAVKKHVIKYCEKVYERSGKNLFWSIKNSGEILDKLKARDFNATSLYTYVFSTLYTTLVKYFTDRSKAVLLLWIFYVFVLSCVCYVFVHVCLYVLCGHLLGNG